MNIHKRNVTARLTDSDIKGRSRRGVYARSGRNWLHGWIAPHQRFLLVEQLSHIDTLEEAIDGVRLATKQKVGVRAMGCHFLNRDDQTRPSIPGRNECKASR